MSQTRYPSQRSFLRTIICHLNRFESYSFRHRRLTSEGCECRQKYFDFAPSQNSEPSINQIVKKSLRFPLFAFCVRDRGTWNDFFSLRKIAIKGWYWGSLIRIEFDAARPAQRLFFTSGAEATTQPESLSSRFITDHVFSFFFHRRCRHFVDCGSFLITPWLMMWKKRKKKRKNVSTYTPSLCFHHSIWGQSHLV